MAKKNQIVQLKSEISDVEKGLKDKMPDNIRKQLQETLEDMKKELSALEKFEPKEKKEKPAKPKKDKPQYRVGDKPLSEVDPDEMMNAFMARREKYKAAKTKTQSVISGVTIDLTKAAEPIVKTIIDSADDAGQAQHAIKQIGDVLDNAVAQLKAILAQFVGGEQLSPEAKKDLDSFEAIANELKQKYGQKKIAA